MVRRRARNKFKISLKTAIIIIVLIILISIYNFCKFYQDRGQAVAESDWVNVELHYIGSAKTNLFKEKDSHMHDEYYIHTDGELTI